MYEQQRQIESNSDVTNTLLFGGAIAAAIWALSRGKGKGSVVSNTEKQLSKKASEAVEDTTKVMASNHGEVLTPKTNASPITESPTTTNVSSTGTVSMNGNKTPSYQDIKQSTGAKDVFDKARSKSYNEMIQDNMDTYANYYNQLKTQDKEGLFDDLSLVVFNTLGNKNYKRFMDEGGFKAGILKHELARLSNFDNKIYAPFNALEPGLGDTIKDLSMKGKNVIVVDASPASLKYLNTKPELRDLNAFVEGDFENTAKFVLGHEIGHHKYSKVNPNSTPFTNQIEIYSKMVDNKYSIMNKYRPELIKGFDNIIKRAHSITDNADKMTTFVDISKQLNVKFSHLRESLKANNPEVFAKYEQTNRAIYRGNVEEKFADDFSKRLLDGGDING